MTSDLIALAAPVTGALAALVLVARAMPVLSARQAAVRRLRAFVDAAVAEPEPIIRVPVASRLSRPRWMVVPSVLVGREVPVAALVVICTAVYVASGEVVLVLAAALQVVVFSSLGSASFAAGRARLLDVQTLPTVMRLAGVLRAGGSLSQAMEAVSQDGPSPTREEFGRALGEVAVGQSVDDALERLADRVGTADYMILSQILSVQRRLGGNLPQVLDTIAETIRDRIALRQEVETLTAQQRMSTWILVLLPFCVLVLFFILERAFLTPLVTTVAGRLVLLGASLMQLVGSWCLRMAGRISI
jgi:tight adherence protein B